MRVQCLFFLFGGGIMAEFGYCKKCGSQTWLTVHHWWPKRWFGPNDHTVLLCRGCHDLVEQIIFKKEKQKHGSLTRKGYWKIHSAFISGQSY